jgi:acetoin utilization deacetylase AcuC-like enzyme
MEKYRLLRERLLGDGVLRPDQLEAAPLASRDELGLAHTAEYLDQIFTGRLTGLEEKRIGLPWSEALLARSCASVGGTIAAAREALRCGIGGSLAGGTHHAGPAHGEGYCVFNDLAVAIRVLQREGAIRRAVVVDLDVHQGDGTARIFTGDPSVFTFSIHGEKNFPWRKVASTLDLGLPDGTGDEAYLATLAANLPSVLDSARADLVLYQAGVDPLAQDVLGRLSLTHQGLRARDRLVLATVSDRGLPVVLTLGGGYAKPIEDTVLAHVGTYREAIAIYG